MSTPLLETKLFLPRPRRGLVPRPRLRERLHQGLAAKLMLVSAPAGFGKTTLLVDWMAAVSASPDAEIATAWLSLDASDNDPATFWTYVIAALAHRGARHRQRRRSASCRSPSRRPSSSCSPPCSTTSAPPTSRSCWCSTTTTSSTRSRCRRAWRSCSTTCLPRLHLVIASRADPALPLPRLRARGDLVEIRAADLRFTPDEAASYLNDAMGLQLTPDDVTRSGGAHRGLDRRAPARRAVDGRTRRRRLLHRRLRGRRPLRRRLPGRGGPATSAGGRPDVPAADLGARPDDRLPVRRPHRAGRRPGDAGGARPGQPVPGPAGRPPPVVPLPPPVRRRPAGPAPRRAARPRRRPAPAGQRAGSSRTATRPRRSGTRWPAATSRARPP